MNIIFRFVTSEYVRIDQLSFLKPFSPTLNGFINTEGKRRLDKLRN